MKSKFYEIFSKDEWPVCRADAEGRALEKGYDTLLCLNEFGKFSGRSKTGVWCVGTIADYYNIANFINYENNYNRKVIIWSENHELAIRIFQQIKELEIKEYMNLDRSKLLCHSTSIENLLSILKDNILLSYNELISQGKIIRTVRFELNEPEDFLDYIDFCSCESIASEIVVASRQFGKINDDNNFEYKPGVRLYFNPEELLKVEGACMDGLHTFRMLKKLSLDYVKAIVFPSKKSLEGVSKENAMSEKLKEKIFCLNGEEYWTPDDFVQKANEIIASQNIS